MLFHENLEEIIFHRHELFETDELIILSGYLGPNPVRRLKTLPIPSKVIYGMYGNDGIGNKLHKALIEIEKDNKKTKIFYSQVPVHSKCYVWRKDNEIVHALVGSANFSTNGLTTPYREVLAETTFDTFRPLDNYISNILNKSIYCTEHTPKVDRLIYNRVAETYDPNICEMTLLNPRNGQVPDASGLNWGHGDSHTTLSDAYIAIRSEHIRNYPDLFPPKQILPIVRNLGRAQRHNESIEIIWDDGTNMKGLLEGTYTIDGTIYPKQISSSPEKSILGKYLRKRLGLSSTSKVSKLDLESYGRTSITVSLLSEGVYYFDFST